MYNSQLSLQNEVLLSCFKSLEIGAKRRKSIKTKEEWQIWHNEIIKTIRSSFPNFMFNRPKEIKSKIVSHYEFDDYQIENVIFESISGWEINGSVYLPKQLGTYPAVICPTGHSNKLGESYQKPAQVFARNGYIAISFDPPGCAGENSHLNDHFTNGLIGYLTGIWSQTHFVIDAIRCIDYLLTRNDVDKNAGISITGVSGGGVTSFFTALLDDRISFTAPVCCLNEHEFLHLKGLYTSCPEQFGLGYIASGIDYVDYISAIAPTPCLVMGGKYDEVFDYRSTISIFEDVKRIYAISGHPEKCGIFIDENSGHAYTVDMAKETVKWMNHFIKKNSFQAIPLTDEQVIMVDREKLLCYPKSRSNMFTINRDESIKLKEQRTPIKKDLISIAEDLLGISSEAKPIGIKQKSEVRPIWHVAFEEVEIQSSDNVCLPALMLSHFEDKTPNPGLLWIDENGKWSALRHGGFLCQALRMFEQDCLPDQPRILSLDVNGFGSLSPEPTAYDLAGWNNIENILTYLSLANLKSIMGLMVRDALCGLNYLESRSDIDTNRLMVGGRGIGAIVALHVALFSQNIKRVICMDMLSHYGALTEKFPFSWRQSIIIPEILKYYDLPEIASFLKDSEIFIINPMDSQKIVISKEDANEIYRGSEAIILYDVNGENAVNEAIYSKWGN